MKKQGRGQEKQCNCLGRACLDLLQPMATSRYSNRAVATQLQAR